VVTIQFTKSDANQSSIQTFTDNVGNTVMIDSGMAIGAINIDKTPPDAFNQFDPVKKDVAVFGRDTLSGTASDPIAPVSVTRAHWRENDDDGDHDGGKAGDNGGRPGHEDPQFNAELRTYLIIDNAGNTLRLVELVSIQGHDMKVRVVSFQYNDGSIVLAGRNEKQFEWKTDKTGTLKGIEQLMSVGGRPLTHLVQAEWEAKTNRTVIQVTDEKQDVPEREDDKKCEHGQHDKKIVKPGLVLLRMAIIDRKLVIEY
jgi:hypothetical protein